MADELIHYGVKGMKWGVRKKPDRINTAGIRLQQRYHRWRADRNQKKSDSYQQKADDTEFKSWMNPSYVIRQGLAKGHSDRAEYHRFIEDFCDVYLKNDGSLVKMLDGMTVRNGEVYVDELLQTQNELKRRLQIE